VGLNDEGHDLPAFFRTEPSETSGLVFDIPKDELDRIWDDL